MEYQKDIKNITRFVREQIIRRPRSEVFSFFQNHANLLLLTPPSVHLKVLSAESETLKKGARYRYKMRMGVDMIWETLITSVEAPYQFEDVQLKGPYAYWRHVHKFEEHGDTTRVIDEVYYRLPFGELGNFLGRTWVNEKLNKLFDYRHEALNRHNWNQSANLQ